MTSYPEPPPGNPDPMPRYGCLVAAIIVSGVSAGYAIYKTIYAVATWYTPIHQIPPGQ